MQTTSPEAGQSQTDASLAPDPFATKRANAETALLRELRAAVNTAWMLSAMARDSLQQGDAGDAAKLADDLGRACADCADLVRRPLDR